MGFGLAFLSFLLLEILHVGGEESDPLNRLPSFWSGAGNKFVMSVDDFGAVGDGVCDDTQAFKDAWEASCFFSTHVVLKIPSGKTYMVGPISFGKHCASKLTLLISGTIVAPCDPALWDRKRHNSWLYFHNIENLHLKGGGTINGMGEKWWENSCKINKTNPCQDAPTAMTFHRCTNLKIDNLRIINSQQMHIAFTSCSQIRASNLKVYAPGYSPNTDGIHISASHSVTLKNSIIRTGDDCISIVSGSSKLRIKNIICGPGHGISIGSLGKSSGWDEVHDVLVDGAVLSNTDNGLRIKTWQGGRGFVRDIAFKNVLMDNVSNPIIIDQYYCDSSKPCENQTDAIRISGISFMNIKGTSATEEAIRFACSDSYPCEDIFLEDIKLSLESKENATAFCWNALGMSFGPKNFPSCFSKDGQCMKQYIDRTSLLDSFLSFDKLLKSMFTFF